MGLDIVELVLSVEEEFGVEIPDADACELDTPRKLADYVRFHLEDKRHDDPRCLSQVQFYRLRRHLVTLSGLPRQAIKLDSQLSELLCNGVRKDWKALTELCGASTLPSLDLQRWQQITVLVVDITLGLIALQAGLSLGWVLLLLVLAWFFLTIAAAPLATRIPPNLQTIRDLVPYVMVSADKTWREDEVLPRVLQLTAIQSGIELAKIQPDHHFIKDLGMD